MFDPLINGRTVGVPHGPLTFIPGRGVRLETQMAYISYELPQTLFEGEFSLITQELRENTEGGKTKLFAMSKGYSDIVENEYRMTVEKRGDPAGVVAWRFIARDDQIDTEGAERQFVPFDDSQTHFWQATWRNNFFNVLIRAGRVERSRDLRPRQALGRSRLRAQPARPLCRRADRSKRTWMARRWTA